MKQYILEGKTPVVCDDIIVWSQWFQAADRHVALTERDGIKVSTVFLGLDHAWNGETPILFETMIFGGEHDESQWRYATWDEAVKGHEEAVQLAF